MNVEQSIMLTLDDRGTKNWNMIRAEIREILIDLAKKRKPIFYSDLVSQIKWVPLEPGVVIHMLAYLLGEISEEEHKLGRGLLSVLVVNKESSICGNGFFDLAKNLGKSVGEDCYEFWQEEFNNVCDYWSSYQKEVE